MKDLTELSPALDAGGVAIALLDERGRIDFATRTFQPLTAHLAALAASSDLHERFSSAGRVIIGDGAHRRVCRIGPRPGGGLVAMVQGAALDGLTDCEAVRLITEYWNLTPSEAETAWRHACGANLSAIAAGRGVALETVRSQMRAARQKVGAADGRSLQASIWSVLAVPAAIGHA